MERLYTLEEAKRLLGVTTMTIQCWDRDGEIWVVRVIGGRGRIEIWKYLEKLGDNVELDDYLEEVEGGAGGEAGELEDVVSP